MYGYTGIVRHALSKTQSEITSIGCRMVKEDVQDFKLHPSYWAIAKTFYFVMCVYMYRLMWIIII